MTVLLELSNLLSLPAEKHTVMQTSLDLIIKALNKKEQINCPFPVAIARVYLNKLVSNIATIKQFAAEGKQQSPSFLFPIKANAYGSGMLAVAQFIEAKKICSYFGVAHANEAYQLRENGIKMPILIMSQTSTCQKEMDYIIENNIEQTISDLSLLLHLNERAIQLNKVASIHLLVDTGMGRCGVLIPGFNQLLDAIQACSHVKLVGVMTHLAVSSSLEKKNVKYTAQQIKQFIEIKKQILSKFDRKDLIFHAANSGGAMGNRSSVFDMIRPGIATYGYPEHDMGLGLQPIMDVVSRISLIKTFPKNCSIGYDCTYKTQKDNERIAIVPIGYGDGLSRALSNQLTPIVNGKKVKSIGVVSMDQVTILVDDETKIGDEVIIIGQAGGVKNDAYDLAEQAAAITYEVICNLGAASRIRHEYVLV